MAVTPLQVTGRVSRDRVDVGSKSERNAVVLTTDAGDRYLLRRQGGPAFGDSHLDELVGRAIRARGLELGRTLIMQECEALD